MIRKQRKKGFLQPIIWTTPLFVGCGINAIQVLAFLQHDCNTNIWVLSQPKICGCSGHLMHYGLSSRSVASSNLQYLHEHYPAMPWIQCIKYDTEQALWSSFSICTTLSLKQSSGVWYTSCNVASEMSDYSEEYMHLSWRLEKLCKAEYEFMVAFPSFKDMLRDI